MIDPNKITWYKNGLKVRLKNRSIMLYETQDGNSMVVQFKSLCKEKECAEKPAVLHTVVKDRLKITDLKLSHEALSTLGIMTKSFFAYKKQQIEDFLKPELTEEKMLVMGEPPKDHIRNTIDVLIHKAEKGEELFRTDPVFRNAIEVIARGADPIKVLANVCEMFNNQNNAFIDHMKRCSGASTLMPDNEG